MDIQTQQQIEQQLRSRWQQVYPLLLDRFTTVSRADLDSATSADDLVRRIADKSHYSERYVEERIGELVGAGVGVSSRSSFGSTSSGSQQGGQQQVPFGASQQQGGAS